MMDHSRVIAIIETATEPAKLRQLMANARRMNAKDVADAAFRRLVEIMPEEDPGTVAHDFWRSIYALEAVLSEERGKTVRLARTRQKIARVGVTQTLRDLAMSRTPAQGFEMLLERNMPELTGEAVVLRYREYFESEVVAAAHLRLKAAGVDMEKLPDR